MDCLRDRRPVWLVHSQQGSWGGRRWQRIRQRADNRRAYRFYKTFFLYSKTRKTIAELLQGRVTSFNFHVPRIQGFTSYLSIYLYLGIYILIQVFRALLVAQTVKRLPAMRETRVQSLGGEDSLEKEMAIHSSILARKIPWTEETGRLQSMGSQRVGHNCATSLSLSQVFRYLHPYLGLIQVFISQGHVCAMTDKCKQNNPQNLK